MAKILVTGGFGFVGRSVVAALQAEGNEVTVSTRGAHVSCTHSSSVHVASLGPDTDWSKALIGVDTVVHLAARVHVMRETESDPMSAFRDVNTIGTEILARSAAAVGVKRIVFLSTIKVNGEKTSDGTAFVEMDPLSPQDSYAISKREAEDILRKIERESGMQVVVIRPPLVYGPGVGGNFRSLLRLVASGLPMPFSSIENRRSLIFVENLASAIVCAAHHDRAAGETFLVSDGSPLSTPALIQGVADGLGRRARLFPLPPFILRTFGRLTGRYAQVARLLDSLVVDDDKIRDYLGWTPPYSVMTGLRMTARQFSDT